MLIKGIKDECFGDFKEAGMLVVFPNCTFKCDQECGRPVCQNSSLATAPAIDVPIPKIIERYRQNPITTALICGGLEPFDSIHELYELIAELRHYCSDPVVIYTGYKEEEVEKMLGWNFIQWQGNIYVKYGRYIPGQQPHYDEVLGVNLASDNQYARYYE